jgi:hypothetical protein
LPKVELHRQPANHPFKGSDLGLIFMEPFGRADLLLDELAGLVLCNP